MKVLVATEKPFAKVAVYIPFGGLINLFAYET